MRRTIVLIFLVLLFTTCTSKKMIKKDTLITKNTNNTINETFDPLSLDENELQIQRNKSVDAKSNYDDTIFNKITSESENLKEIVGYRVQICAVSNEETARNIQRDAIMKLNKNIYLIFDSPYYKVRVGDCVTRYDAEILQKSIIRKGFNEAWVVKTKIRPNEDADNNLNTNSEN